MKKIILFMLIVFTTIFSVEKVEEPIFIHLLEFYKEGKPYTGEVEGYGGEDINLLYEKANYKDGFLDGKYTRYNSKGEIIGEVIFDKGKIVSGEISTKDTSQKNYYTITTYNGDRAIIKKYYDDGSVLEKECKVNITKESRTSLYDYGGGEFYILDVIEDGAVKGYSDGKLVKEFYYKNGELDGEYKEYFKNGNLKAEGFYENGKGKGVLKKYFATGELYQEQIFNEENLIGEVKEYFKTGELYSEGKLYDLEKIDTYRIYTIFGDKAGSKEYVDGELTHTYRNYELDYKTDGWIFKVDEEHNFYKKFSKKDNEIKNGEYDIYYDNGQLKQRVTFKNGVEIGESIIYDRMGEVKEKIDYTEILNKEKSEKRKEGIKEVFIAMLYVLGGIISIIAIIKVIKRQHNTPSEERCIDYNVLVIGIIDKAIRFILIKISSSVTGIGMGTGLLLTIITLGFIKNYSKSDEKYKRKYFQYFVIIVIVMEIIMGLLLSSMVKNSIMSMWNSYRSERILDEVIQIIAIFSICEVFLQAGIYQWMKKLSYEEIEKESKEQEKIENESNE